MIELSSNVLPQPPAKSKSVAILLAVFLSYWTWLYTYKRDNKLFWICVALTLVFIVPIWPLFLLILQSTSYETPAWGVLAFTWIEIGYITAVGLWIWALMGTIARAQSWYDQYPFNDAVDQEAKSSIENGHWRMTLAEILLIIAGAIIILNMLLQPVIYTGWETYFLARLITPLQLPVIILALLCVCGGSYGLFRKSWGTTLTGTISAIVFGLPSLTLAISAMFSGAPRLGSSSIVYALVLIMGVVSLVFLMLSRKRFRTELPQ